MNTPLAEQPKPELGLMGEDLNQEWESFQEAERVLEQMARILAPAQETDLAQLAELFTGAVAEGRRLGEGTSEEAAERQLRNTQARYQALVEQIPAITFMAPLDGTVSELYVSPQIEAILGFSAEEWLNNPILWYSQLHPEDQNRWQEEFARTLNTGEHFASNYRFIARDGRIVWVHGEARVIGDGHGQPLFLQGVAFDITEQMEAQEKLRKTNVELARARDQALDASRAKSAFLANMSHELRTPLHAILGFGDMLYEDMQIGGHDSFLPDMEKINGSAKHLVGLINNILDLSKIEAGKMELFLEDFEIESVIGDIIASAMTLIDDNRNTLEVYGLEEGGLIHGDQTKLRQILLNLLSNAAKFTEGGLVTVQVQRLMTNDGEKLRVSVTDSGIGIAPNHRKKLFQSFSQADDSTTRKYGGTGLGLAISQRFCQMMGGAITVQSELGKGSTFTVELPTWVVELKDPQIGDSEEEAISAVVPEQPHQGVLVISRKVELRDQFQRTMSRAGGPVETASPTEAVEAVREFRPRTILLDVSERAGWETLGALKGEAEFDPIFIQPFCLDASKQRGYTPGVIDLFSCGGGGESFADLLGRIDPLTSLRAVLIIDSDQDRRELLSKSASRTGWAVAEAPNGWFGFKAITESMPGLIVLSLDLADFDGFEFVQMLRGSEGGRETPIVLTFDLLTDEEADRYGASMQELTDQHAQPIAEFLTTTTKQMAPFLTGLATTSPIFSMSTDPPMPKPMREAMESLIERPPVGDAQKEKELNDEIEMLRRQLRERQHAVELLRTEYDEMAEQTEQLEQWKVEAQRQQDLISRLQAERDAAIEASRRQPLPSPSPAIDPKLLAALTGGLQRLERIELEAERSRRREKRRRRARAKTIVPPPTKQPDPITEVVAPIVVPPPIPTPEPIVERELWFIMHRLPHGEQRTYEGTTEEVREWIEAGRFKVGEVRVCRTPEGIYRPLHLIAEFTVIQPVSPPFVVLEPVSPVVIDRDAPRPAWAGGSAITTSAMTSTPGEGKSTVWVVLLLVFAATMILGRMAFE